MRVFITVSLFVAFMTALMLSVTPCGQAKGAGRAKSQTLINCCIKSPEFPQPKCDKMNRTDCRNAGGKEIDDCKNCK